MAIKFLRDYKVKGSNRHFAITKALCNAVRSCVIGSTIRRESHQAHNAQLRLNRWKGEPADLRRTLLTIMAGMDAIEVELLGLVEAANSHALISAKKSADESHRALIDEHHSTSVLDIMEILNVVAVLNPPIRKTIHNARPPPMILEECEKRNHASFLSFKLPMLAIGFHSLLKFVRLPF